MRIPEQMANTENTLNAIGVLTALTHFGKVEGYGMGGSVVYGFDALSCLRVKWGTNKTTATIHRNFVERTDGSK